MYEQVIPVLPLFAQQMGLGASGVGFLIALPSISSTIFSIPIGRMADKIGRVPLMRAGRIRLWNPVIAEQQLFSAQVQ